MSEEAREPDSAEGAVADVSASAVVPEGTRTRHGTTSEREERVWPRFAMLGGIAVGSLVLLSWLITEGWLDEGRLPALLEPFGVWAYILFIVFYAMATMIWAPGTVLALGAVSLFHPVIAIALSVAGFMLGGSGSWFIARFLGRSAVKRMLERRKSGITTMTEGFRERAFMHVLVMRLLGLPNNIPSYLSGAAGVPWRTYALATFIGVLPAMTAATLVGGSVLSVIRSGSWEVLLQEESLWTLGSVVVSVIVLLWARRRQKRLAPSEAPT